MSRYYRSPDRKRAHSPYSSDRYNERRRHVYRDERVTNKYPRSNDSYSNYRRRSPSRSSEYRPTHSRDLSNDNNKRREENYPSHYTKKDDQSNQSKTYLDSSLEKRNINSNITKDIRNHREQPYQRISPRKYPPSEKCPFLTSNISSEHSSPKEIEKKTEVPTCHNVRNKELQNHCNSDFEEKEYVSHSKTSESNKNVDSDIEIIEDDLLTVEVSNKTSQKTPNLDKEPDSQESTTVGKDRSGSEPASSLSSLNNQICTEKQASNSDCTSTDEMSQGDNVKSNVEEEISEEEMSQGENVKSNVEEEISEESRLIQMNPALREFVVLDDLEGNEHEENEAQQSSSSEYESDVGEEVPLDDLDAMLEEGLPDKFKDSGKNKEHTIRLKRKVVLEEIGHDHFDLLPEGWIQIMHNSGMPVYLHQKSRVCTMARPYYLGPGSSRNHKIPLSAIPCLQYRRALEVEKKNKEEKDKLNVQNQNQPVLQLMAAKIETSEENEASQSLEALDLREYCNKIFNFKTITLIPFKSWADRRKYVRMTKDLKKRQRPSLPGGTKLLKFPTQNPDGTNSRSKGEWIINPNGKSYVCILHEYVQHALRKHPKYQFKELENPATPYSATVFIGDMQYSVGVGASKKQAKVEAAKTALEVLIPEMKDKIERDSQFGMRSGIAKRSQNNDISIFDQIKVEDPRVAEFCAKTTEPPPYAILLTCLSRNMGLGDIKVNYEMNSKKHKEDEFTMTVGNHAATVTCKNKRDGKQRAAQAILQSLHPNITYWGSLLRMYGNRSIKNVKEKKQEEQEITGLQSKASLNQPNFAILEKLKSEMLKLKEKREAVKAKGKFTPPENIILPSLSSTDLNKVNLS